MKQGTTASESALKEHAAKIESCTRVKAAISEARLNAYLELMVFLHGKRLRDDDADFCACVSVRVWSRMHFFD
jgi:hypothetical protein